MRGAAGRTAVSRGVPLIPGGRPGSCLAPAQTPRRTTGGGHYQTGRSVEKYLSAPSHDGGPRARFRPLLILAPQHAFGLALPDGHGPRATVAAQPLVLRDQPQAILNRGRVDQ